MSTRLYVASPDSATDLGAAATAIVDAAARRSEHVTVFRPLADAAAAGEIAGASFAAFEADPEATQTAIITAFDSAAAGGSAVAIGTDHTGVTAPVELALNGQLAADLALPVILAVDAGRGAERAAGLAATAVRALTSGHATVVGLLATGAGTDADTTRQALSALGLPAAVLGDDLTALLDAAEAAVITTRTPARLSNQLMSQAQSELRTIVLPESEDPRILEAASIVAGLGVAKVILLGQPDRVLADAGTRGLDLTGVEIVPMDDPERLESYAAKYAELRAAKGVTLEQAREVMKDGAYFGTMMVYLGAADGLVSGANHTTANTIRPALQFIKTQPGMRTVSGALLMSLADRVLVFADCAVTPNPTPEQLADIAIASDATARLFGVDPRIAMLSYSTGTSGKGPDVDLVREGFELATARAPELKIAGPIQFDAAIDPVVGAKKLPGSPVAGQATVFVFPDLNTGNNTYKAVQRTAGALAIGPLLQGLRRPVNDLSRGALVEDIVNTIIMTAIQAQGTQSPLA